MYVVFLGSHSDSECAPGQRFPFVAEGAVTVGGILFAPLVKEGTTGKL